MEITLSEREVKFLLNALKDASYIYTKYGSRDFAWEEEYEALVKKLKGES